MSIFDRLEAIVSAQPKRETIVEIPVPGVAPDPRNVLGGTVIEGRRSPRSSQDLERIINIPRRPLDSVDVEAIIELMTRRLRRDNGACDCEMRGRRCILRLKGAQAWALYELGIVGGLLGPIGVGAGKTGLDILAPMVVRGVQTAALLIPPNLVDQFVAEYRLWRNHWNVPSLITQKGAEIEPGNPALHVIPYSRLSRAEATVLLESLNLDLIIGDEAHKLRHADTARTSRFLRVFAEKPDVKFCGWSGSLTDKSIRDYAHLSALALGENSPLPINPQVVAEWSATIDPPPPGQAPAPLGSLVKLCRPGQTIRDAFKSRLLETRGVVATQDPGIGASLYMHKRDPGDIPAEVQKAISELRGSWTRPDGEELVDAFAVARCARELACGFFYRWIFPHGEPEDLIREWFAVRSAWHKEMRSKLGDRDPHMDQPLLLARAARRYWGDEPSNPELPEWASSTWCAWRDIRDQVQPESEAVWISDYLVRDAAAWGTEHRGVIWVEHRAFGQLLQEVSGFVLHGGGPQAQAMIAAETGERSIIASIRSHGEGRDGLQRLFSEQLVANPPVSRVTGGAARWEQLLGRLHREGQQADEVETWIYRHTSEMREAWDRARELASYVTGTIGSFQKLLAMTVTW